jgi:mannose PTS system EIID component
MKPRLRAIWRLLSVQAAWTYERMGGIGVGYASAPLLDQLLGDRPADERRAAAIRSATFFNSHPYLAGIAVGATVRAEEQHAPPAAIARLRAALSGPLGAIGDQLIWAGEVPALIGLALALAPWLGAWGVLAAVILHNVVRLAVTAWGLDLGLREGLAVGGALDRSWLRRGAERAQRVAAFGVGAAIPIVAWHLLTSSGRATVAATLAAAVVGSVLTLAAPTRAHASALRVGLGLLAVAIVAVAALQ